MQSTLDPTPQTVAYDSIQIVTDKGFLTVTAEIYGNWAIHNHQGQWRVTHIGTGLAAATLWHRTAALWVLKNMPPLPESTADLGKWRRQLMDVVNVAESLGNGVHSTLTELAELIPSEMRQRLRRALELLDELDLGDSDYEGDDE